MGHAWSAPRKREHGDGPVLAELSREDLLDVLAERDAALAGRNCALATAQAQLAAPHVRAAERAAALLRDDVRPGVDDVLYYLAFAGFRAEAFRACGINSVAWRLDAQLRRETVAARHGAQRRTRLHWACEKGYLPRVKELIDWGSDVEAEDELGCRPLNWACWMGHLEVVRELVRRGAVVTARRVDGLTLLHEASIGGHVEVARLLLDSGADIEAKANTTETPLYSAIRENKPEAVHLLVTRGANVNAHRTDSGDTPLIIASWKGHALIVRALLAAGADVSARATEGRTALHLASSAGHVESLRELLKRDLDVNARSASGVTPLMEACACGHLMAATLLIASGADVHLRNNAGGSALDLARNLVRQDAQQPPRPPPAAVSAPVLVAPPILPTAAQIAEHKKVVAQLEAHGAT